MQKFERGQPITLRIPVNVSVEVLNHLECVRQRSKRGFAPEVFRLLEKAIEIEKVANRTKKP